MRKKCPFCKGKVLEVRGVGGLTFFECTNRGCACIVSFKGTEKRKRLAEKRWDRRE